MRCVKKFKIPIFDITVGVVSVVDPADALVIAENWLKIDHEPHDVNDAAFAMHGGKERSRVCVWFSEDTDIGFVAHECHHVMETVYEISVCGKMDEEFSAMFTQYLFDKVSKIYREIYPEKKH